MKILVVDDDPDLVFILKTALEKDGYAVSTAGTGLEGLEKAKSEHPDLILLDLMMPKMDGQEMNIRLKKDARTAGIPVVILTGYGRFKELMEARKNFQVAAYLEKPVPLKKILETIKQVLGDHG